MNRLLLVVVVAAITSCGDDGETLPDSPLEQMEIAFDGNPSEAEIRPQLDRALTLYGESVTDENYSRAGSVLVGMSSEHEVSEMAILDCMIRSHVAEVDLSFADGAAFAAVLIASTGACD